MSFGSHYTPSPIIVRHPACHPALYFLVKASFDGSPAQVKLYVPSRKYQTHWPIKKLKSNDPFGALLKTNGTRKTSKIATAPHQRLHFKFQSSRPLRLRVRPSLNPSRRMIDASRLINGTGKLQPQLMRAVPFASPLPFLLSQSPCIQRRNCDLE